MMKTFKHIFLNLKEETEKNILEWSRPREFVTPQQRERKKRKESRNLENLRIRFGAAESGQGEEDPEKLKKSIEYAEHGALSGHWDSPQQTAKKQTAIRNLLVDILGKQRHIDSKESIQADWDRRNPDRPRDPTGSFGERPRRDVYLNLLGFRNNIKGVIKRDTPLGQRLGSELRTMPDPNPRAGGQWPEIKGETHHFSDPTHPASVQSRILALIRMQLGTK